MTFRDSLELMLLALLWGVSFVMMRMAAPEFGPVAMVSARVAMAGVCLLPLLFYHKLFKQLIIHYKPIMMVGIFNSCFPFCMLGFASLTFTAGYTSIINATTPLWTAIVAALWLKNRMNATAVFGLALGFFGVVAMVWGNLESADSAGSMVDKEGFWLALAAGLAATLSYGSITNFMKKEMTEVNSLAATCGSLIFASVLILPFGIYYWPEHNPSWQAWAAVFVMAVFSTAWGIVLFFRLIRNIGPQKAITVTYLIPVVGMGLGALFLDEQITQSMIIGCVLILSGVSLATGLVKFKSKNNELSDESTLEEKP